METFEKVATSLEETQEIASNLLTKLTGKKGGATVVFFRGDLGAGKTTFTQSLAKALGVKENVISPTFILQKKYTTTNPTFKELVHIDAYRFEDPSEANVLGLDESIQIPGTLFIIEWPERLGESIQSDVDVLFTVLGETVRKITWQIK